MLNQQEVKAHRIHDSITKILSQGSICMAITEIANKYYIAANEVNSSTTGKKFIEPVETVKNYILDRYVNKQDEENRVYARFKTEYVTDISKLSTLNYGTFYHNDKMGAAIRLNGERVEKKFSAAEKGIEVGYFAAKSKEKKNKILKEAFTEKIIGNNLSELIEGMWKLESMKVLFGQNASMYTTTLHGVARDVALKARTAIQGKTHRIIDIDELKLNKEVGDNAPVVSFSATAMMQIEDHARKVMEQCKTDSQFAKKLTEMAWVYGSVSKMRGENYPKIHAEMKVLSKILDELNAGKLKSGDKVYIGISKACCFHCHHTLEAANHILEREGIQVKYREAHDVMFQGSSGTKEIPDSVTGWSFPFETNEQKMKKYYKEDSTVAIIQAILKEAKSRFKGNEPQQDVSMDHAIRSQSPIPDNSSLDSHSVDSTEDTDIAKEYALSLKKLKKTYAGLPYVSQKHNAFVRSELEEINMLLNYCTFHKDDFIAFVTTQNIQNIDSINAFNNIATSVLAREEYDKEIKVLLRAFQGENAHSKIKEAFETLKIEDVAKKEDMLQPLKTLTTTTTDSHTQPHWGNGDDFQDMPGKYTETKADSTNQLVEKQDLNKKNKSITKISPYWGDDDDFQYTPGKYTETKAGSTNQLVEKQDLNKKNKSITKISTYWGDDGDFQDTPEKGDSMTTKRKLDSSKPKHAKKRKLDNAINIRTDHDEGKKPKYNSLQLFNHGVGTEAKLNTLAFPINKGRIEIKKTETNKNDDKLKP